jgi:PhnB protein
MPFRQGTDMTMSLSGDNETELRGYYEKLAVDGTVVQPLMTAPWGDTFGAVNDKYGVKWMVNISGRRE